MTIGWILTEQGDYGRAEKHLASAREAYLSLEDQPGLAMCLAAQANVHRILGDPTSARFWCERSLEIARTAKDSQVTAVCLTALSLALFEEGEPAQAIDALIEARSLAREVGAADTEHLARLALARILLLTDRLDELPGLLSQLLERAEQAHLAADIPSILLLQAVFKSRFGEVGQALRLLDDAITRSDQTGSAETRWELRQARIALTHPQDRVVIDRLDKELAAWVQSCSSTISEDDRRKAFSRRVSHREAEIRTYLSSPAATVPPPSEPKAAEEIRPPEVSSTARPAAGALADEAAKALQALCESAEQEMRLRAVLNLLVDRAVHGTHSMRGGLFLTESQGTLVPVALRSLVRDSLEDARDLSASILRLAADRGEPLSNTDLEEDPVILASLTVRARQIPAILVTPVADHGVLYLDRQGSEARYDQRDRRVAAHLADHLARVLRSMAGSGDIPRRMDDLELAINQLDRESVPAEKSFNTNTPEAGFGSVAIVGTGPPMRAVFDQTRRLASSRTPVLIVGETGTGKELIARALHEASAWRDSPFVALDCGALTENLAEAELFGHARGAFSGAHHERPGLLRSAGDGTLFLDEIGNLAPPLQLKLLRALETGEVRPVGSDRVEPVSFRLVAATNIDLGQEIKKGRFREDLFHRLQGGIIRLPPLRDHMEDLEPLVTRFLEDLAEQAGRPAPKLTPAAWKMLHAHSWPGNVRELRMALQVALAMTENNIIEATDLPERISDTSPMASARKLSPNFRGRSSEPLTLGGIRVPDALEGKMVLRVLAESNWDKAASARKIGWSRQKLYRSMRLYRLPLRVTDGQLQQLHDRLAMLQVSLDSEPRTPSAH